MKIDLAYLERPTQIKATVPFNKTRLAPSTLPCSSLVVEFIFVVYELVDERTSVWVKVKIGSVANARRK